MGHQLVDKIAILTLSVLSLVWSIVYVAGILFDTRKVLNIQ